MKKKIKGKIHWRKLKSLTERQIVAAAKSDPDAKPLTPAQLKKFKRVNPPKKSMLKRFAKNSMYLRKNLLVILG